LTNFDCVKQMKARPVQNVAAKQALACGTLGCGDCLRQPVATTSFIFSLIKKLPLIVAA
jgi:hypothetical protein